MEAVAAATAVAVAIFAALLVGGLAVTSGSWTCSQQAQASSTLVPAGAGATAGLAGVPINQNLTGQQSLTYGTSSGQCNIQVLQARTLAASSSETLDLYGSTTPLTQIDGSTALFRHVTSCQVWIASGGDTSGVTIGNAAVDPWAANMSSATTTNLIYPGALGWQCGNQAGIAVTTGSGQLKILNNSSTASVTYIIAISGTTT